ncbi:MAG: reverse transcriptase family protein [Jatrophihabitantaceae bacterium]
MSRAREQVAQGVATALLAGPWERASMRSRCGDALGERDIPRWVGALVVQVLEAYRDPPADRPRELAAYLQTRPAWELAWQHRRLPRIEHWAPVPSAAAESRWPVRRIDDDGELARLLDLDVAELAWFADVRSLERRAAEPLRHYRWRALPKRGGTRLVAAPKPRLKEIQRRLLRHVLAAVPPHPAAHGCVAGHSVRSALAPHAGSAVVTRLDVESFFASITAGRVWGLLRMAGLPESVAHTVTGLVSTVVPLAVWQRLPRGPNLDAHRRLGRLLAAPHLPQGAPSSPALANLAAFWLDRRLAGLAAGFGAQYTRYVDDLTFSGGPSLRAARSRFVELVGAVVRDEGLRLNERKTVVLGSSGRQQVLGAVLNVRPTLSRRERDALRALLHNCAVHGWRSQARGRAQFRSYVLGRVGWAGGLDPVLGARLRASFDAIDWG